MSPRQLRLAAIATAAGALSGLFGVGGGTIIVPLLVLWLGYENKEATGTSLAAIIVIGLLAAALHAAYGNVDLEKGVLIGLPAVVGVIIGTAAQQRLSERAVALGFAAGMAGGLVGIGGGVLFVPALVCSPSRPSSRQRPPRSWPSCWCRCSSSPSLPCSSTSPGNSPRRRDCARFGPVEILDVHTEDREGRVHVALRGELDLSTVGKVQDELRRVEASSPPVLVLDLSKLTFLDSTGLRCLVTADERGREEGRRVVIVRGPEPVQRVFSITRLEERLDMVDDAAAID